MKRLIDAIRRNIIRLTVRLNLGAMGLTIILAALIGIGGGFGAVGFQRLIRLFRHVFLFTQDVPHLEIGGGVIPLLPFVPMIGLVLVAWITNRFAEEAKGHGVPEVMSAIAREEGVIRPRLVVVKALASAICIGSGGSVGREGPIVQIGSAFGSTFGQAFKLSGDGMKILVACGAAAGISATFNAPIAGAIFASEIILSNFAIPAVTPIIVSSVLAAAVSRHYLGDHPAFAIPSYTISTYWEFAHCSLLGMLAGAAAVYFTKVLYKVEDVFDALKTNVFVKAMIGGLIVGLVGCFRPEILGVGYGAISKVLTKPEAFSVLLLGVLCLIKPLVTATTLGAGGSGGIFSPSLFIGGTLGAFFGSAMDHLFPQMGIMPGAYAVIGMSAVVAGTTHAPIQAILILFEMTGDYKLILPLMTASVLSTAVARAIEKESIYTMKLSRRGEGIQTGHDLAILERLRVSDAMDTDYRVVKAEDPLDRILDVVRQGDQDNFPVVENGNRLFGMISYGELRQVLFREHLGILVVAADIASEDVPTVTPDDSLLKAFQELGMRDASCLPVVDGSASNRLLGVITREKLASRYRTELLLNTEPFGKTRK